MESGFLHQFVQQLINGISLGSIYALIALGYTMIYGILKLINFAHGDIYMLGAYIGFVCTSILKLSFLPALIVSMIGAALAGMVIERVAYRPMRNAPRIAILITAIGVSFFLENVMILFASPQPRTFPAVFTATVYHVGAWVVNSQQIVILISALVLMVALTYIVNQTRAGKAMRAVSFDADAARLMGIDIDSTISMTFARSPDGHGSRYQSLRCRGIGRHRHHSGGDAGRNHFRRGGSAGQRFHFFHLPRCRRVCDSDHYSALQASGPDGQKYP